MSTLFMLLSTVGFVLFIIGLFNPKAALFWMSDKEKRKRGTSSGIYIAVWLILGFIGGALAAGDDSPKSEQSDKRVVEQIESTNEVSREPENWNYFEEKDEMSDEILYIASCVSTNMHEFDFPYNGAHIYT